MDLKDRIFVIFGTEHGNPLGLARSLGENGIAPIGILLRDKVPIASKCKYWKQVHLVDSVEEGYGILLDRYAVHQEKGFLFSTDDSITSFLNSHYDRLAPLFFYNSAPEGGLSEYMQKANQMRLAARYGLQTARYWEVDKGVIPEDLVYPIITKPGVSYAGEWKNDMHICRTKAELEEAYKSIACPRVILQRYIDKKNEMTMEGLSVRSGKQSAVAVTVSFLFQPANGYGHYMVISPSIHEDLEKKIFSMLEEIGYDGLFEAEFLVDQDDQLYFLEINFRSSLWNHSATDAGIPLPLIWAQAMLEPEKLKQLCENHSEPFRAMDELNDFRDRVMTHQVSFLHWLKEFHGCKCRYYLGKKDPMPMVSLFTGSVHRKLRKVLKIERSDP